MTRPLALALGLVLALAGCGGGGGGGGGAPPGPTGPSSIPIVITVPPTEAPPIEPFVNDPTTTFDLLDVEVGLDRDAARNIIDVRDGLNGVTQAALVSLDDLDPIPEVGPVALARVERFAANWSLFDPDPLLAFVNDPLTTHAVLRTVLTAGGTISLPSATAQAIIDHRAGGVEPFDSRSELLNVTGVGVARLQDLEHHAGLGRARSEDSDTEADLRAVSFAPDGRVALIVGRSEAGTTAYLYDTSAEDSFSGDVSGLGDEVSSTFLPFAIQPFDLSGFSAYDLHDVAWSPDGRFAIAVGESGKVLRFDRELRSWTDLSPTSLTTDLLSSVAIAPSGRSALISDLENARVLRLDLVTGAIVIPAGIDAPTIAFSRAPVFGFTSDGGVALAPSAGGRLYAIADFGNRELQTGIPVDFSAVAFDASGGRGIFGSSGGAAVALRITEVQVAGGAAAHLEVTRVATRSVRHIRGAAFRPGVAQALLVGDQGEVLLHDFGAGWTSRLALQRVSDPSELENRNLRDADFSSSGGFALIVGDRGLLFRYVPSP